MDKPSAILPGALDQLKSDLTKPKASKNEMGQEQFFDLMVTQLQNQDPFNPMESGDFLGQIAQFSTVNGISELQKSFAALASSLQSNQALQASTMVGRDVVIPRDTLTLKAGEPAALATTVTDAAANVRLTITDGSGQIVRQTLLGPQNAGRLNYVWDGTNDAGQRVAAGGYRARFDAAIGGQEIALETSVRARVDSVSLARNGLPPTLNVDGYGTVDITDVLEIL
jgi:flagellar basal-body rod modification protein FlgD